jgi:PAS domain-containing protein
VAEARCRQQEQALVERAKGLLTVRLGCSPETAHDHLLRTARERRLGLPETAATILGAPAPSPPPGRLAVTGEAFRPQRYLTPPDPAPTGMHTADRRPVSRSGDQLVTALEAATDGDAVASALWVNGLRELGANAVLLGVLEPDGAVRLVGTHGLAPELVRAWTRTPSTLNVAYLRAVATGRPLWISRQEATERGWHLLGAGELRACLPLHETGQIFGVASVLWPDQIAVDSAAQDHVMELAELAGRRLSDVLRSGVIGDTAVSPAAHWARTIVAALPPSYALVRPVRRGDDIADWMIVACSPDTVDVAGRPASEIRGHTLRDLYPLAGDAGIAAGYSTAWRDGGCVTFGPTEMDVPTPQGPVAVTVSGRAARFGDGLLTHWHRHDDDRLPRRLRLLEKATDAGWARWDMDSGKAVWSPAAYTLLRRDPRRGPVRLGALHRLVAPAEQQAATSAVHALTRFRQPVDRVFTIQRHGRLATVRFAAHPVMNEQGRLTGVRGVFQHHDDAQRPPADRLVSGRGGRDHATADQSEAAQQRASRLPR